MPGKIVIASLLAFLPFAGTAQLVTNPAPPPSQLVQNTLLGPGVTATNVSYSGTGMAIGYFDGSNTNIGLNSGVILTTGTINNQTSMGIPAGPHGPNTHGGAGLDNGQPGDPALAAIAGNQSYNAAILEFDFVPNSDTISFNYVFGSEEYIEYVNQSVNDIFAFFITGPNPSGGSYNNTNIALIPGTQTSVNINTLNHISNSQYYNNNGNGTNSPYNSNPYYVQYDGFTDVLKAQAAVNCGQQYHIKIAISDIGDGILDSGVFLEAGSFSSPKPLEMSAQLTFNGFSNDSVMAEGCADAVVTVERYDSINHSQTFPISYSGSAANGIDFSGLPNSVTFAPGQTTATFTISSLFDGIPEGMENLVIELIMNGVCGGTHVEELYLYIDDVADINVQLDDLSVNCPGVPITLSPTVTGGLPGYDYQWSTGASTATIQALPQSTQTYYVTVTDTCGRQSMDSAIVTVPQYQPLSLDAGADQSVYCPNTPVGINASVSGGGGNYQIQWSDNLGTSSFVTATPYSSTMYYITVTDTCGVTETDSIYVTVDVEPLTFTLSPDIEICPGDTIDLTCTPSGGDGPDYDFLWSTGETDSIITVAPSQTTTYSVGVMDGCGTYQITDSVKVSIAPINADFSVINRNNEVHLPVVFHNESQGASSYFWDLGNGYTTTDIDPVTVYDSIGYYTVTLIAYSDAGCTDTTAKTILVRPEFNFYAPNAFSPNGDGTNDFFFGNGTAVMEYNMMIFNRWGELIFETNDLYGTWDGTVNGKQAPLGVYVYKFKLRGYDEQYYNFTGHVTLVR